MPEAGFFQLLVSGLQYLELQNSAYRFAKTLKPASWRVLVQTDTKAVVDNALIARSKEWIARFASSIINPSLLAKSTLLSERQNSLGFGVVIEEHYPRQL